MHRQLWIAKLGSDACKVLLADPLWRHHRLITDAQGRRLAKRDNAHSLRQLREEGWTAERVRGKLGIEE